MGNFDWYYEKLVENEVGRKLKVLRSGNGDEFVSKEFIDFCKQHGIRKNFITLGDPQSNGVAERMNMTLLEKARYLRLTAGLSRVFWAEALSTTMYIINRIPAQPLMGRFQRKGGKSLQGIFLDYIEGIKGYRIWNFVDKKIVHFRHVTFEKSVIFKPKENPPSSIDSEAKRPKEMETIPTYQPSSRVRAAKEDGVIAVVDTSDEGLQNSPSNEGDGREGRDDSAQGGVDRSLDEVPPAQAISRAIRSPNNPGKLQPRYIQQQIPIY